MVKLEFYLSDADMDRLWAIKEKQGKDNLTGNEFAKEILEVALYNLHPEKVKEIEVL